MIQQRIHEVITGRVEATSSRAGKRGVKLGETWYDVSRFAGDVALPPKGATVALHLDKDGYIRRIDAGDAPAAAPHEPAAPAGRERAIVRQTALKAAVEFLAAKVAAGATEVRAEHVLALAERFEAWVCRDGEGAPDER